jgi:hypothetical protein
MSTRQPRFGEVQLVPSSDQIIKAATTPPPAFASWVDWYNKSATADQQNLFDRVTRVLDAGGADYMQGGSNANYIDKWRFTEPEVYQALVLYRDSGGRRALFAAETPSYGDKPIAAVTPNGPIVKNAQEQIILRPGRYTYSAVQAQGNAFFLWLSAATAARNAQVLRTQASEEASWAASLYGAHEDAIYIDYEFLVAAELPWDPNIPGLPAWLPKGTDVTSYWGKPSPHAAPNLDALREAAEAAKGALKGLTSMLLLGGAGYLFFLLAGMMKSGRRQTA